MLLGGAGAVASWAVTTATLTNNTNTFTVASVSLQDTTGANTTQNFTDGASYTSTMAAGTATMDPVLAASSTMFVKVEYTDAAESNTGMTLTPETFSGTGTEADMDIAVTAGTGCSNLTAGTAATTANACTGGFTPFASGSSVVATSTLTAAIVAGAVAADGASGSGVWTNGDVVTFQVVMTEVTAVAPGTYIYTLLWTSSGL
jgi:hypothetical protein